jgi:DNA segregation ATPase FtsK/SpoIIIE, S-DNA-T family
MHATKFYRPARSYPPVLPIDDVVIKAPPVVQQNRTTGVSGLLQYALPALGGLGSLLFVFVYRDNILFVIAGIMMAVGFVGSGFGMYFLQRYWFNKQRKNQRKLYLEYLDKHRTHLQALADKEDQVNRRLYPDYPDLARLVEQQSFLWERRPDDQDFLTVRIGTVPAPLSCHVSLEEKNDVLTEYEPELLAEAEALINKWSALHDMPALISLRNIGVLTVVGKSAATRALTRALLCQIVAFQSAEDVRCMVCFPPESTSAWSWLKWLPHVRRLRQVKLDKQNAPDPLCLLATNIQDVSDLIFNQIRPELDRRRRLAEDEEHQENMARTTLPHLFVILDAFSPFDALGRLPELDALLSEAGQFGLTVICLVSDLSQEPTQVQARLSLNAIGMVNFEQVRRGGTRLEGVTPDAVDPKICERLARRLSPLLLVEAGAQQDLSQDVPLLNLMSIPDASKVDAAQTWRPRSRQALLNVPIGIRADGEPLFIDFKEAADKGMGPHGLIIGATGSGKSELLRTLVVSLAITHDPQTLNFVLIDFKGGASFADFEALPHVAGVITNLEGDLTQVDRVYRSLLGEQLRRQRLLHDAGNLDNIKQYQAKWQMNPDMEPMANLLIIADEFTELIVNQPAFLDLFITIGRVGRSLGMHLLFATQRLEEGRIRGLEGHLRYRICLRTFSASESKTVLGTGDAYYLPSAPGVGYFKVDADLYLMFKTALISVPYVPAQEQVDLRSRIRTFTETGKLLKKPQGPVGIGGEVWGGGGLGPILGGEVWGGGGLGPILGGEVQGGGGLGPILGGPEGQGHMAEEPSDLHTEMDVVIERLVHTSLPLGHRPAHQVWLPPLPTQLPLSAVLSQSPHPHLDGRSWSQQPPFGILRTPVGLLDNPQEQMQEPFLLDFSSAGGHLALVGAPQTGKSSFLRMLVTSFMLTHTPKAVQIYCIDLGGGLLRVFEQAPHVGSVCGKAERDKIRRTVRQMRKVIEDREYLFREHGIDSMTTFRARREKGEFADFPFGDVFLIIDNFGLFMQEFDPLEDDLIELAATGLTYGVHLVLAANRWAEIRVKVRDNIGTRLELRVNDPLDSEFGKAVAASIPVGVPGRGLNKDKLQFQVALPIVDARPTDASRGGEGQQALEELVQRVRQHWNGPPAPPVLMLPFLVPWSAMPTPHAEEKLSGIPLGLEEFRQEPVFIDLIAQAPHFLILGDTECGKTTLLRAWMRGIECRYKPEQVSFAIIDYRKTLLDFADSRHLVKYAYNSETLTACVGGTKATLQKRVTTDKDAPLASLLASKRWTGRHLFLFIDDYDSLGTTSSGPLSPLVEYLPIGSDIGFHIVVARRVSGMSRSAFEPLIQRLREMSTPALIMSGDPQEGKIMHNQAAVLQPPGRGYLARRNQPSTLIQVVYTEPAHISR